MGMSYFCTLIRMEEFIFKCFSFSIYSCKYFGMKKCRYIVILFNNPNTNTQHLYDKT